MHNWLKSGKHSGGTSEVISHEGGGESEARETERCVGVRPGDETERESEKDEMGETKKEEGGAYSN